MSLSTLTLLYSPLIWNSHARIPHSYSGSLLTVFLLWLIPFVFLVVVKREQTTVWLCHSSIHTKKSNIVPPLVKVPQVRQTTVSLPM